MPAAPGRTTSPPLHRLSGALSYARSAFAQRAVLEGALDGGPSALPFGIAPTGFTRLMQTEGEIAGASAAGAAGIPFTLSTLGTTSIEHVKEANPLGRNWFQLYVMRDRGFVERLIDRARADGAGSDAAPAGERG